MQGNFFIDTNVLIYLFDRDVNKKNIAKELLKSALHISIQVCNELTNILIKKFKVPHSDIKEALNHIETFATVHSLTLENIDLALDIKERYGYSFYDSLILSSAIRAGCDILYTEDLQHNQKVLQQLTIVNPFQKDDISISNLH